MARYAGGGKNTVESCRSIDVLEWHRRGYLGSSRRFSWAWTRDGERVASIKIETQAPFPDAEIRKPLVWRGLERCRAACGHCLDAMPVRWRAALVRLYGRCKRSVLRSPGHQAVRRRTAVRLPPLLSACLCQPARIGPSAGAWKIAKDTHATGRKPKHA